MSVTLPGDLPFGATAEKVLRQVGATYRVESGVWHIVSGRGR